MFCSGCGSSVENDHNYCACCGQPLSSQKGPTERELVELYFFSGYQYEVIIDFLGKYHDIHMSLSTLKRRLREFGLKRYNQYQNSLHVRNVIMTELDGAGCTLRYRSMWHTLRIRHGIVIPRQEVQTLMRELDPEGCEVRRRRRLRRREYTTPGPSFAWHVGGYDKLKDFGFPIHGCIDGFSRKILWLFVSRTDNDPRVTAAFYLDCVREQGGSPVILITDPGSENPVMATMQSILRSDGTDEYSGENSHRFVESKRNQRIEAWWSFYRRNRSTWWINFFKDLADTEMNTKKNAYGFVFPSSFRKICN